MLGMLGMLQVTTYSLYYVARESLNSVASSHQPHCFCPPRPSIAVDKRDSISTWRRSSTSASPSFRLSAREKKKVSDKLRLANFSLRDNSNEILIRLCRLLFSNPAMVLHTGNDRAVHLAREAVELVDAGHKEVC